MRVVLMVFGFAAAFCGDWFLAIRRCGVREPGFLCGIAAFACAHLLWSAANWKESKVEWKVLPVVLLPVVGFFIARVHGQVPETVWRAALAYAVVSAVSLAVAVGTRRWFYSLGIGALVLSDVFLSATWVHAPRWGDFVMPVYFLALVMIAVSTWRGGREARFACGKGNPLWVTSVGGLVSAGFFVWAMLVCPNGSYNPLFYVLSYLGRTNIKDVSYPLTHYLFILGMAAGSAATLYFIPYFRAVVPSRWRRAAVGWGAAICVGGLLLIALVPENEKLAWHLNGCYLTMVGGTMMAVSLAFDKLGVLYSVWMVLVSIVFNFCIESKAIPFSPYATTMQKVVIVSFMLWQLVYAVRIAMKRAKVAGTCGLGAEKG